MHARRATRLVATGLGMLIVFDASRMVHAGEGMPAGATRSLVLAVGRPLDRITSVTGLDGVTRTLAAAFGHEVGAGGSPQLSADDRTALPPRAGTGAGIPLPGGTDGSGTTTPRLRVPSAAEPLRLLVTGDSLSDGLGPMLASASAGTIHADTDTRSGTGLVRPDFFDWAGHAREQIANRDPEAIVVALGGNDGQAITMPDGSVLRTGSPEWCAEYRRRAVAILRIWSDGGRRRVYWTSLPPTREPTLNGYFRQLRAITTDAVREVPGARFVNIDDRLSKNGEYSSYLTDDHGRTVLARTRDGVHLTLDGARIAANILIKAINTDWHIPS
ncbi:protein of unknown function DUF459 [Candidatus Protofrankia californiensis]|uniref:SGNH hydrolase-type esterase domain-containing protein n=1 Tax=Candidatus Protofrankia californiensis TaxID=1839754 RepID=A0A1C3NV69_9ACTN|nr:protein of unknown function DUF459 [Candidatus Protofrankia californiensis]